MVPLIDPPLIDPKRPPARVAAGGAPRRRVAVAIVSNAAGGSPGAPRMIPRLLGAAGAVPDGGVVLTAGVDVTRFWKNVEICSCDATAVSACAIVASAGEIASRVAAVVPSTSWRTR